jgi:hypothetical protein
MIRFGHIRIGEAIYPCLSSPGMERYITSDKLQLLCRYTYRENYNHRVMVF